MPSLTASRSAANISPAEVAMEVSGVAGGKSGRLVSSSHRIRMVARNRSATNLWRVRGGTAEVLAANRVSTAKSAVGWPEYGTKVVVNMGGSLRSQWKQMRAVIQRVRRARVKVGDET